jgi:hypothetical protein
MLAVYPFKTMAANSTPSYYKLIDIPVPANFTGTTIAIPPQDDIRYARIINIQYILDSEMLYSPVSNNPTMFNGLACYYSLTLETNDPDGVNPNTGALLMPKDGRGFNSTQSVRNLPLMHLNTASYFGGAPYYINNQVGHTFVPIFQNTYVLWDKSFLTQSSAKPASPVTTSILLLVAYSWFDVNGNPIPRN